MLRLRSLKVFGSGWSHRKVDIEHPPTGKTIAFQTIPAANGGWRNPKIVGNRLDRVIISDVVHSEAFSVSLSVATGVPAWSNWNDQFGSRFDVGGSIELVGFCDCPQGRLIRAGDRHESIAR